MQYKIKPERIIPRKRATKTDRKRARKIAPKRTPKAQRVTLDFELTPLPRPPALIIEPINAAQFAILIHAARLALESVDRFVQLHKPDDEDVTALEILRAALKPYLPN